MLETLTQRHLPTRLTTTTHRGHLQPLSVINPTTLSWCVCVATVRPWWFISASRGDTSSDIYRQHPQLLPGSGLATPTESRFHKQATPTGLRLYNLTTPPTRPSLKQATPTSKPSNNVELYIKKYEAIICLFFYLVALNANCIESL